MSALEPTYTESARDLTPAAASAELMWTTRRCITWIETRTVAEDAVGSKLELETIIASMLSSQAAIKEKEEMNRIVEANMRTSIGAAR